MRIRNDAGGESDSRDGKDRGEREARGATRIVDPAIPAVRT